MKSEQRVVAIGAASGVLLMSASGELAAEHHEGHRVAVSDGRDHVWDSQTSFVLIETGPDKRCPTSSKRTAVCSRVRCLGSRSSCVTKGGNVAGRSDARDWRNGTDCHELTPLRTNSASGATGKQKLAVLAAEVWCRWRRRQ